MARLSVLKAESFDMLRDVDHANAQKLAKDSPGALRSHYRPDGAIESTNELNVAAGLDAHRQQRYVVAL